MEVEGHRGQVGVTDVMVHNMTVVVNTRPFQMLVPPTVLKGKSSAQLVGALEDALNGHWSLAKLRGLPHDLIFLQDVGDSAGSNRKAMAWMSENTKKASLLYWLQRCMVHQLFRGLAKVLNQCNVRASCRHNLGL